MKQAAILVLLNAAVLAAPAVAAEQRCSEIKDADARLACFDRLFPSEQASGTSERTQQSAAQTASAPTASKTPEAPKTGASSNGNRRQGLFSWPEKSVINGQIVGLLNKDKQRMAFKLDNGEVWVQSSPRNLPFKVGDTVTIKAGTFGGHILRNNKGTTTRVSRSQNQDT